MNWTGTGVAFPRDKWASALKHGDIKKPGIYILWGYSNSAEDPRPGAEHGVRPLPVIGRS